MQVTLRLINKITIVRKTHSQGSANGPSESGGTESAKDPSCYPRCFPEKGRCKEEMGESSDGQKKRVLVTSNFTVDATVEGDDSQITKGPVSGDSQNRPLVRRFVLPKSSSTINGIAAYRVDFSDDDDDSIANVTQVGLPNLVEEALSFIMAAGLTLKRGREMNVKAWFDVRQEEQQGADKKRCIETSQGTRQPAEVPFNNIFMAEEAGLPMPPTSK